jgi:hypothetical protein
MRPKASADIAEAEEICLKIDKQGMLEMRI